MFDRTLVKECCISIIRLFKKKHLSVYQKHENSANNHYVFKTDEKMPSFLFVSFFCLFVSGAVPSEEKSGPQFP